jgi:hypothetical protein
MTGSTENISRSGMAIRIPSAEPPAPAPVAGDYCEIYLELPQHPRSTKRSLFCRSAVAWVRELEPNGLIVGLSVDAMEFRDLPVDSPELSMRSAAPSGLLM